MKWRTLWCESLNGHDGRSLTLQRKHRARLHGQAVHVHDTRTALGRIAADVRAGQAEPLPEETDEQRSPFDLAVDRGPVYRHGYVRHGVLLFASIWHPQSEQGPGFRRQAPSLG